MRADDLRMRSLMAACKLASAGINETLLKVYYRLDKGLFLQYTPNFNNGVKRQRASEAWTRGNESYLVVRAHRVFITLFPNNLDYALVPSVCDLWLLCHTYKTIYPKDPITPNRLHYMITMVRTRKLRIKDSCPTCSKPFLIHEEEFHWLPCGICERAKLGLNESRIRFEREDISLREQNSPA